MVKQYTIQTHKNTFDFFRKVKVKYSAKIERQLTDNELILCILLKFVDLEKIKID